MTYTYDVLVTYTQVGHDGVTHLEGGPVCPVRDETVLLSDAQLDGDRPCDVGAETATYNIQHVHYSYSTRMQLVHSRTLLVYNSYTYRTLLVRYSYITRT